jgi:hypothetical protein
LFRPQSEPTRFVQASPKWRTNLCGRARLPCSMRGQPCRIEALPPAFVGMWRTIRPRARAPSMGALVGAAPHHAAGLRVLVCIENGRLG